MTLRIRNGRLKCSLMACPPSLHIHYFLVTFIVKNGCSSPFHPPACYCWVLCKFSAIQLSHQFVANCKLVALCMWLMHFASELSYPFIWCSKTSKQLEVLMKVLTLKMFIFIQLAFTFVSVGIPTDILCRYHTYSRPHGIKNKRQWVNWIWIRYIDRVLVVLSSGPLPRGQSALVVRLVFRRSWLQILVESPGSFLVASLSHRTLSSVKISWGM